MTNLRAITNYIYQTFLYAWYHYPIIFIVLWPFSLVYRFIIAVRYYLYRKQKLKSHHVFSKVIVVGNLVVGGTGKTPMVISLAEFLKSCGFKPGIITRGYHSKNTADNIFVTATSDPTLVGDEAVLIAQKTNCPVVKNKNRAAAAELLSHTCDIIISDDGLQHYRMARDIEIAMMPDKHYLKNNFCLPAGPWREAQSRLKRVDFMISLADQHPRIQSIKTLQDKKEIDLAVFQGKKVHAVCAIAMPWRFFALLAQNGIEVIPHAYPDHAVLSAASVTFSDNIPVLITEKDAVKCAHLTSDIHVVEIAISLNDDFKQQLLTQLEQ